MRAARLVSSGQGARRARPAAGRGLGHLRDSQRAAGGRMADGRRHDGRPRVGPVVPLDHHPLGPCYCAATETLTAALCAASGPSTRNTAFAVNGGLTSRNPPRGPLSPVATSSSVAVPAMRRRRPGSACEACAWPASRSTRVSVHRCTCRQRLTRRICYLSRSRACRPRTAMVGYPGRSSVGAWPCGLADYPGVARGMRRAVLVLCCQFAFAGGVQ